MRNGVICLIDKERPKNLSVGYPAERVNYPLFFAKLTFMIYSVRSVGILVATECLTAYPIGM